MTDGTKKQVEDGLVGLEASVKRVAEEEAGEKTKVSGVSCGSVTVEDTEVCVKCEAKCADDACAEKVTKAMQEGGTNTKLVLPATSRRGRSLATVSLTSSEAALTTVSTADDDATTADDDATAGGDADKPSIDARPGEDQKLSHASVQSFSVSFIASVGLAALGALAL